MSIASSIILLLFIPLFICIPLLIGIYVYRDAKNRGMNAPLWTLIALLVPTFIGFIIYLLVRTSYSNLKCPKCETAVTEQYISCPNCGTRLRATCPNCSTPVESGWKVCPRCATPLPEQYHDVSTPIRQKDKMLGKILIAVILIPILIILMILLLNLSNFTTYSGGAGITITSLPVEEYLREI